MMDDKWDDVFEAGNGVFRTWRDFTVSRTKIIGSEIWINDGKEYYAGEGATLIEASRNLLDNLRRLHSNVTRWNNDAVELLAYVRSGLLSDKDARRSFAEKICREKKP